MLSVGLGKPMAVIDRSKASIRFGGDDLDPDVITAVLGEATFIRKKGQAYARAGREFVAPRNVWLRSSDNADSPDLDLQLTKLFASLSPDTDAWRQLTGRYRAEVFVGLFLKLQNEGIGLAPGTLAMIAERGLEIGFDIYGPDRRRQMGRLRRRYHVRLAARYSIEE